LADVDPLPAKENVDAEKAAGWFLASLYALIALFGNQAAGGAGLSLRPAATGSRRS
jgi:hypothetical protein